MKKHFNGGNKNAAGGNWEADLKRALNKGDIKTVKHLVDSPPGGRNVAELRKAAHSGNIGMVKRLLDNPQVPAADPVAPRP